MHQNIVLLPHERARRTLVSTAQSATTPDEDRSNESGEMDQTEGLPSVDQLNTSTDSNSSESSNESVVIEHPPSPAATVAVEKNKRLLSLPARRDLEFDKLETSKRLCTRESVLLVPPNEWKSGVRDRLRERVAVNEITDMIVAYAVQFGKYRVGDRSTAAQVNVG